MMRICPSCGEKVPAGRNTCKVCGYDFTERIGTRPKAEGTNLLLPGAAVLLLLVAGVVVWQMARSRPKPEPETGRQRRVRIVATDSVSDTAASLPTGMSGKKRASGSGRRTPAQSSDLTETYYRKIDDLENRAVAERRRLQQARRMTPQADELLSQIEAQCREVRGLVGSLSGAPNDQSRKAVQAALDARIGEIRKLFVKLKQ